MKTVRQLYEEMSTQKAADGENPKGFDQAQLDCLLDPGFEAGDRLYEPSGDVQASKDVLPVLKVLSEEPGEVFAIIAPAITGQFEGVADPGKIRSSLKAIGFKGMVEAAAFADILTLKEALEFDHKIHDDKDFMLSSCCCPMWISMVRRECPELFDKMPASVSPMIAAGRVVKHMHPGATTVFIGPCMAKKKEAKEVDIDDAVDYVLTFSELQEIFELAEIHPADMDGDEKEHSSRSGRIYAFAGGVSEAVQATLGQLNREGDVAIRAKKADGALECKKLLAEIKSGEATANFYEGMGCKGGCVGGPKKLVDSAAGKEAALAYGEHAAYATPLDNPFILEMLHRMGYETIRDFIEKSDFLTRDFGVSKAAILQP
ncbi:MAG: hypothetical protein FWF59_06760 [Turicibacter sp.]|nr:hypothetical protein [Turicibacter sp.]